MKSSIKKFIFFSSSFLNYNIEHDRPPLFGFIDLVILEFNKNKAKFSLPWNMIKKTCRTILPLLNYYVDYENAFKEEAKISLSSVGEIHTMF